MSNNGWISGSDHKALGELLASVDSLDEIDMELLEGSRWRSIKVVNVLIGTCWRYRRKQRKLAAPWQEIEAASEFPERIIIGVENGKRSYRRFPKVYDLQQDGWKYWMPLSALPPIFEDEK